MRLGGAWPFLSKRRKVSHHQDVSSSAYRPLRQSIRYLKIELSQIVHTMEAAYAVSLSGLFGLSGAHIRLKLTVALLLMAFYHFGNRTAAGRSRARRAMRRATRRDTTSRLRETHLSYVSLE